MENQEKKCIRCEGSMIKSHILKGKELIAANTQEESIYSLKLKSTRLMPYICTECGYCEFYAEDIKKIIEG